MKNWRVRVEVSITAVRWEAAAINDMEPALLKCDLGLVRESATELYHVLDHVNERTSAATGAQDAELHGLEAFSFLLVSCESISTLTAVAKLVEVLATSFQ